MSLYKDLEKLFYGSKIAMLIRTIEIELTINQLKNLIEELKTMSWVSEHFDVDSLAIYPNTSFLIPNGRKIVVKVKGVFSEIAEQYALELISLLKNKDGIGFEKQLKNPKFNGHFEFGVVSDGISSTFHYKYIDETGNQIRKEVKIESIIYNRK